MPRPELPEHARRLRQTKFSPDYRSRVAGGDGCFRHGLDSTRPVASGAPRRRRWMPPPTPARSGGSARRRARRRRVPPSVEVKMPRPALESRYGMRSCAHSAGIICSTVGTSSMTPSTAAMPPALLRIMRADTEREDRDEREVERTAEERQEHAGVGDARRDVDAREDHRGDEEGAEVATRPTRKVATNSTIALAASAGRRFGTAVSVERIMPVVYSPLMTSTPSTPTTSWPKNTPNTEDCTMSETWSSAGMPEASAPPFMPLGHAERHDERHAERDRDDDQVRPGGRAEAAELDPFGAEHAAEGAARWSARAARGAPAAG